MPTHGYGDSNMASRYLLLSACLIYVTGFAITVRATARVFAAVVLTAAVPVVLTILRRDSWAWLVLSVAASAGCVAFLGWRRAVLPEPKRPRLRLPALMSTGLLIACLALAAAYLRGR